MASRRQSNKSSVGNLKIAVLGMGHVGLPTALGMADLGWEVTGADDDAAKIARIEKGEVPFYEPGLPELLAKHLKSGKFKTTHDVARTIRDSNVLFICVGTPQKESGEADLTQVEAIALAVASNLNGYKLIVEKSTVPAITAQWVKKTITRYAQSGPSANGRNGHSKIEFDVASNPEFLQEGKAVENFFQPDRIVIGVESDRARDMLEEVYRPLNCPLLVTNTTTAELIKHAANAFLSMKISFINMVSDICEEVGADVASVARGIGLDPRIGTSFLSAGIGFGGYCFPKDLRAFIHLGEEHGVDCSLLSEVENINHRRTEVLLDKVRRALWVIQGKTIGVLGLAFKPLTDDIREAPGLKIVEALRNAGAVLQLHDPEAMPNTRAALPPEAGRISYHESAYDAAKGAHALLVLTEWDEYRKLDLSRLHDLMEVPVLVDGRNIFDPESVQQAGFEYSCMGRATVSQSSELVPRRKPRPSAGKRGRALTSTY